MTPAIDQVCNGLFACGTAPQLWYAVAALVILVALVAIAIEAALHERRSHREH